MRELSRNTSWLVPTLGLGLLVALAGCSVEAGEDAGALAEKFAREFAKSEAAPAKPSEPAGKPKVDTPRKSADARAKADQRKAEEAEMLARARAEAEQRRAEMLKARELAEQADREKQEAVRQASEEKRIAQERARLAAEQEAKIAEARRVAEQRRVEEEAQVAEQRRIEALRIAEAQRRADEERRFVEARRAEEEARAAELQRLQAQRLAEDQQKAEERRLAAQAEAERARLGAVREAEAQRLAERLRQAREDRERAEQQTAAGTGRGFEPDLPLPSMRNSLGMSEEAASAGASVAAGGDHVAVLLVMQPGNRGIRRHNKSADPVLCTYSGCFVSNGPDRAVTYFPGHSGLGLSRTFGERAGSCSNSLGCVFRGIELAAIRDHLGPIDMRVIRHDRREMQHGIAVSDCRLERGRLACTRGIHSSDYTMWIVPESLASRAGVQMLEQAVAEGLPEMERVGYAPSLR